MMVPGFGLALGGGGSRAFIHFGVLKRLHEEGLAPAVVSGSSMGAVLGALYASSRDFQSDLPRFLDYFRKSSLFGGLAKKTSGDGLHTRRGFAGRIARNLATASIATAISFRKGLRRVHPVNLAIDHWFAGTHFESLQTPFAANALNLSQAMVENFSSGPLAPALKASVAVGLVFAPFEWNGNQFADAAPVCPVPAGLCRRLGCRTVLAVDICAPLERPQVAENGFDVVRRIMSVQSEMLNECEIAKTDILLKIDGSDVFWGDFSHIDDLVERGYKCAWIILDQVRAALDAAKG